MKVDFIIPHRLLFGNGVVSEIEIFAKGLGKRALVICGGGPNSADLVIQHLHQAQVECIPYIINAEPTVSSIDAGVSIGRESKVEFVVAVGGGSAIDTGKAVSAMLNNPGLLRDYLEIVGSGKPLANQGLPLIAIPTTAGTGSEVTRNAVIGVPSHGVKVSLRSQNLLPTFALIDPQLTLSMPKSVTAASGMDAITQLIESFVSRKANIMTDMLCREGMAKVAHSLQNAYEVPSDISAREDVSWASLLSGMALANSGLGAVHGFAGIIGGLFEAPHGAICARLLPEVMAANFAALSMRSQNQGILEKYKEIAELITRNPNAEATDGIDWLYIINDALSIPRLGKYGMAAENIELIVDKAVHASSMKSNPVELEKSELIDILLKCL